MPREIFVDESLADIAYEDRPLPIEAGQTISQPYIVALMLDSAQPGPDESLLEVGAGSGYAAAVASRVAGSVTAIERHGELARLARQRIERLGFGNVTILEGDGTLGCPDRAPFDIILAAASGRDVPQALVDQLAPGGRLVMPVGGLNDRQALVRLTRDEEGQLSRETLMPVRFVPLIGAQGWPD